MEEAYMRDVGKGTIEEAVRLRGRTSVKKRRERAEGDALEGIDGDEGGEVDDDEAEETKYAHIHMAAHDMFTVKKKDNLGYIDCIGIGGDPTEQYNETNHSHWRNRRTSLRTSREQKPRTMMTSDRMPLFRVTRNSSRNTIKTRNLHSCHLFRSIENGERRSEREIQISICDLSLCPIRSTQNERITVTTGLNFSYIDQCLRITCIETRHSKHTLAKDLYERMVVKEEKKKLATPRRRTVGGTVGSVKQKPVTSSDEGRSIHKVRVKFVIVSAAVF
ncbi:hypothetical protein CRE_25695 [Caenorhabditis remanei]|uniref:Uncharacterized protein n=1 Tax=Caenorhabditis remanei TaxID=31234 RepID=E3ML53_CAERE|nr:hypothetical protein CRE_25695 [Caenorhabditis remanei]